MKAMNKAIACAAAALVCSAALADEIRDYRAEAVAMMKRDFKTKGIATADRVHEDGLQAICNRTADNPPKDIAARLEKDQLENVRYPADGKLMGDWKAGEKLAQSGRGMTWSDKAGELHPLPVRVERGPIGERRHLELAHRPPQTGELCVPPQHGAERGGCDRRGRRVGVRGMPLRRQCRDLGRRRPL